MLECDHEPRPSGLFAFIQMSNTSSGGGGSGARARHRGEHRMDLNIDHPDVAVSGLDFTRL
jgi:hypothetical protein